MTMDTLQNTYIMNAVVFKKLTNVSNYEIASNF
jgi:hypothetical protein